MPLLLQKLKLLQKQKLRLLKLKPQETEKKDAKKKKEKDDDELDEDDDGEEEEKPHREKQPGDAAAIRSDRRVHADRCDPSRLSASSTSPKTGRRISVQNTTPALPGA